MYENNPNMNQFNSNSQNNNIYADINSNYVNYSQPNENLQVNGNIYSFQNNNGLIPRENEKNDLSQYNNFNLPQQPINNNYIPPIIPEFPPQPENNAQFGVQPNIEIKNNYEIQPNNNNNIGYAPQINNENNNYGANIPPYKVEINPEESPDIIPHENDEDEDENFWDRISPSVPKLDNCQFCFIIILGIIASLLSVINIIIVSNLNLEENRTIYIIDIIYIIFGVIVSFSALRIKCLRYAATGLSVFFIFLSMTLCAFQIMPLIRLSESKVIVPCSIIAVLRFIEYFYIMHKLFYEYFEVECCCYNIGNIGNTGISHNFGSSHNSKKDNKSPFNKRKKRNKKKSNSIWPKKTQHKIPHNRPPHHGNRNYGKSY